MSTPGPLSLARAFTVVSGGPLVLAAAALVAPVAAVRRWPDRARGAPARRTAWAVTAAALALPWVYAGLVRPWLQHWGSTPAERATRYPGDADRRPLSVATRAVRVDAPAEEVWRWLVQIGQDKAGFYSYDWLENLAGCRLHTATRVHPEWQDARVGDPLTLFPGVATRLAEVDPPRALVIEGWGAYLVQPDRDGSCRLVARSHVDREPRALAYYLGLELPHALMERRMLLGIKAHAEAAAARL
ncbi:SRPBCC family protein [Nocardioides panaciterrulae]|uniref:SRPBCC family protein n=1 Tax=Nocardioides panaciterrulae TaxID=661492 RepID=A0A7Y9E3E1_9ACTN|nr:SRPBCC family protein [Nocardioides panaciterrulae]NYD40186.1 hypothetical protein [Nocardioides panaciterrulae]